MELLHTKPESLREIENYIFTKLPEVLEHDPRFATLIEGILSKRFPKRDEFAQMLEEWRKAWMNTNQQLGEVRAEIKELRSDMDQRFEKVDQRFEQVDQRFEQIDRRFEQVDQRFEQVDQEFRNVRQEMKDEFRDVRQEITKGFQTIQIQIDRLGARWGIRNESVFRRTMKEVLEKSFGVTVEERLIVGEQFDCIILDGQHILIEITASAGKDILDRLQRKRQLYKENTGITPSRFILAVGSIYSRRAEELRANGFEVIEPEEE